MKIRMHFNALVIVVMAVVFLGVLALIGLDIAMLAGALYNTNIAIPIVSLVAALIIGVAVLLLIFNSYYGFKQNHFSIVLGFFADKISYDDVILLKQNIETKEVYAIVKDVKNADAQVGLRINVSAAKADAFLAEMRNHIPNISVDIFSAPKKSKKG